MPTYEYRCRDCHATFQATEHIEEHLRTPHACPNCKGSNVEQVFSAFFAKTGKKS